MKMSKIETNYQRAKKTLNKLSKNFGLWIFLGMLNIH